MGFLIPSLIVDCGDKDSIGFHKCVDEKFPYLLGFGVYVSLLLVVCVLIYLPKKPRYPPVTPLDLIKQKEEGE